MKVGIVAGEKSGDYLGAELIKAIRARYPNAEFVGLAGPLMKEAGATSLAEMDKISIMGIVGALKGARDILSIRKRIREHMLAWRPDVFIGIDVPDFNLRLEIKLKEAGIPTVHYVSPTVWAWRSKRIVKIKRAVNLMLTLFPFEETFYKQHQTPVKYVGHPLAKPVLSWEVPSDFLDELKGLGVVDEKAHLESYRCADQQNAAKTLVALLPGSRMSEVSRLMPVIIEATKILAEQFPSLRFVVPAASDKLEQYLSSLVEQSSAPIHIISGHSRDVLSLCHIAILASGTAALEAALFAKPMVVMYKVSKLEEWYASRTMIVKHFSMPNHLTNPPVVPELIQESATAENLVVEVQKLLNDQGAYLRQREALQNIAPMLSEDTGVLACDAIAKMLASRATRTALKTQ